MKRLVYLFFLTAVFSCESQKRLQEKIVGKYEAKSSGFKGELLLNKDSSFVYKYSVGLIKSKSEGVWEIKNKNLHLKSNDEYLNNCIRVTESLGKDAIFIHNSEDKPIQGIQVVLNNEQTILETNDKGTVFFNEERAIKNFSIYYLGETYSYNVLDSNTNNYKVTLYTDDLSKTYFDDEMFEITKKYLSNKDGIKFMKSND